ncbi:MAG: glycerophosphodiester phosphodiesterase [Oceanospirillaceae bacterium]|nr:glycerophosphodiester phosphodiesterase [Oceanospirillaceae bacterium]
MATTDWGAADRLVAHRGYAARYPENTLLAVRKALEAGARYVEVDIQLTADRVPVVFHDPGLERMCGCPGDIHQLHSSALPALRCPYPARFGSRFVQEPLATLAQLAVLIDAWPEVRFFIELKPEAIGQFGNEVVLRAVAAELDGCRDSVVLISYERAVLHLAKAAGWCVGAVEHRWPEPSDLDWQRLAPDYLFLDYRDLPDGTLQLGKHTRLALFEVAEPGLAKALFARGAALIETFEIDEMRRALQSS